MSNWNGWGSSWNYSRWLKNIARNSRITEFQPAEIGFIRTFLKLIWNPITRTGTRPWLATKFNQLSMTATADYAGDIDIEPIHIIVKMVEVVGRDFKKIPISNFEKIEADILIADTGDRRLGTKPYFGNVGGSVVSVP